MIVKKEHRKDTPILLLILLSTPVRDTASPIR